MRTFLWIAIVGSVLAALAANGAPQPLASLAAPAQAECDCSKLKALQLELRNALRLQQAFRGKIADLRKLDQAPASAEFKKFAAAAAKGLTRPEGDTGPEAVEYTPYGDSVDTGILKTEKETPERREQLCGLSRNAKQEMEDMKRGASCAGVVKAVEAHEAVHWASCRRSGYVAFRDMHGADRAQEEVDAYGAQIAVLRAEIAKVLEHANVRIETETTSRMTMPPNPLYTAIVVDNRAVVPMSSVSVSGEVIKFDGEGKQTNNATVEGHCKFTGGLPFTITLRGSIETEGLEAQIRLALMGTLPSIAMECATPQGAGHGMSIPINVGGGNIPVMNLPLENGAEKVFDQSTGEGAKMMAGSGVRITGQSKIRLIFCEK